MESSVDPEADYSSLMDFKMAEQAIAAGIEEGAGSQSGTFFGEDASGGRLSGGEFHLPPCTFCGKVYRHRQSMHQHMQMHRGLTRCRVCAKS